MDALLGLCIATLAVTSLTRAIRAQLAKLSDPAHLRKQGVFLMGLDVLEATGEPIGCYQGAPIYATVRYLGATYRYAGVVPRESGWLAGPNELRIDPGVVYVEVR